MAHALLSAAIAEQLDDLPVDEEVGSLVQKPFVRLCLVRPGSAVVELLGDEEIEDDEMDFLEGQAGLIVSKHKDGSTNVRYFADEDALEDRWADLVADLEDDYEDEDLDDEDDDEEE